LKEIPFLQEFKSKKNFRIKSSFYFSKSEKLRRTFRISVDDVENIDQLIKELSLLKEVEYVEKVPLIRSTHTPNDLKANTVNGQWGLHKIQAQNAWDITKGSSDIVVAVVDDAIQTHHPDLAGKFVAGRDVSDNDNNTNPPQWYFGHGTHVAGIAGASTNNGKGIASIGYNVKIMPIKATPNSALPQAYCKYKCVLIYNAYEGVTWAADNGADVINMSWGGFGYSQTNQDVMNNAANQGAILVAAAGNSNSSIVFYPAAYDNVISVAATDINDNRSVWDIDKNSASNYGSWIDVSAPGSSIKSTIVNGNGYANWNGTSMASPMVAGLCGLILSVNPALTPSEVENCILSTADQLSNSNLGAGRINAFNAVQCAGQSSGGACSAPTANDLTINPTIYCGYGYVYCENHETKKKKVLYKKTNQTNWDTAFSTNNQHHYISLSGLSGGTYEYKIAVECTPNSDDYSDFTPTETFTAPSCKTASSLELPADFTLYPNPAIDLININLDINEKFETIQAYNPEGRLVKEWNIQDIEGSSFQLDLSELNKGMYMLRINNTHIKKFTKL